MTKRAHTQRFRGEAKGFVSATGKHRISIGFDGETMDTLNRIAKKRGKSVSSTVSDIVTTVLAVGASYAVPND